MAAVVVQGRLELAPQIADGDLEHVAVVGVPGGDLGVGLEVALRV